MGQVFCWFYSLTMSVIYITFILLVAMMGVGQMVTLGSTPSTGPIIHFQSFMYIWAFLIIPLSVILMWWCYSRQKNILCFLFGILPAIIIFLASKNYVAYQLLNP